LITARTSRARGAATTHAQFAWAAQRPLLYEPEMREHRPVVLDDFDRYRVIDHAVAVKENVESRQKEAGLRRVGCRRRLSFAAVTSPKFLVPHRS
jgi:hypothetical protein